MHVGFEGFLLDSEQSHYLFRDFRAMRDVTVRKVVADVDKKVAKLRAVNNVDRLQQFIECRFMRRDRKGEHTWSSTTIQRSSRSTNPS